MPLRVRSLRALALIVASTAVGLAPTPVAWGQVGEDSFVTGAAQVAYEKWQTLMQAVAARDAEQTEFFANELLNEKISPLRLALLEERAVRRSENAGAVLLFEQDMQAGALKEGAAKLYAALATGREQMNEADDGWYFCSVGRFDVAAANFKALVDAKPDPVALLEFADRVARRTESLNRLVDNPTVGEAARGVLSLLQEGEERVKADPIRVKQNIDRLGGAPRAFENSVAKLRESGEYAVPFMVQYLRDPAKKGLTQAILRTIPKLDRRALNPLVMALRVQDLATQTYLVRSLAQISYWQSTPYLLALRDASETPSEVRQAAEEALSNLASNGVAVDSNMSASDAFLELARGYWENRESLAADHTLDFANVWYWKEDLLQNIEVPTTIFDEIMSMRCCEEALRLNADSKAALALWVAANLRREAQLPAETPDHTRPANYPSAAYFAQSAGPEYCLMALALAIDERDAAVAQGAIEALRRTAGPASLVGISGRQPLAEALSFPDRLTRIRAGLALATAMPTEAFPNYQNLMPVLSEALQLHSGATNALVIDPDAESNNRVAAALRESGYNVVTANGLVDGLQKARIDTPGIDVIFLASDISSPDLVEALDNLSTEIRFAGTPKVLITREGDAERVRQLVNSDPRIASIPQGGGVESIGPAIARASRAAGAGAITPEVGGGLALEAAAVLRALAAASNPLFKIEDAETALASTLESKESALRVAGANALALVKSANAQTRLAEVALDDAEAEEMRIRMFAALAEGGKRHGALLTDDLATKVREVAESASSLPLRTAASQALGALNLPGNPASAIIRNQYGG